MKPKFEIRDKIKTLRQKFDHETEVYIVRQISRFSDENQVETKKDILTKNSRFWGKYPIIETKVKIWVRSKMFYLRVLEEFSF